MSKPEKQQRSALEEAIDEFAHLPQAFAMRGPDGVEQVREPAWHLLADGFYGQGVEGTLFLEGEIIIANMTPNFHLEPLNQAAGEIMRNWLESLPMKGTAIDIADLAEAAAAITKHAKVEDMTPQEIEAATYKLAVELKRKRDHAQQGLVVPPIAGASFESVRSARRMAQAPSPLMNARMVDQSRSGRIGQDVRRGPETQRRVASAAIMNQPGPARGG